MQLTRYVTAGVLVSACVVPGGLVHAQIGFTATERFERTTKAIASRYGSVALYPVAPFQRGGVLSEGRAGTATDYGGIIAMDLGIKPTNSRIALEAGGWFWSKGQSDLYQLHARVFVRPEVAVQLGYLGSTKVSGHPYTAFLIYELNLKRVAPTAVRTFAVQIAPGVFVDPTGGRTTSDFTFFVQVSVGITKNLTVNTGQWYVRNRAVDLNRFTLGVGYSF